MKRSLIGKKPSFRTNKMKSNPLRVLLWLILIAAGIVLLRQIGASEDAPVQPLFRPTPTPTRTVNSFVKEAEALFEAGKISDPNGNDAISAYRKAISLDPDNPIIRAELARLLTYSSSLLSTQAEQAFRMTEARDEIDIAVDITPDNSNILAIKALVYDWSAFAAPDDEVRQDYLLEAQQAASYALRLDPENHLALAFYAEVLLDQNQWNQAMEYAEKAVTLAPDVMDTHRVYATVQETFKNYRIAIEEYEKAAQLAPNLTFLYIRIGVTYRSLGATTRVEAGRNVNYETALEYFEKAANINTANGVNDPLPYIGIAKTYIQMGEFFAAALNAQKALEFDPTNANTYGQLGIIYSKARNWESSALSLECAVQGCSINRLQNILEELGLDIEVTAPVEKMDIANQEVAFYYATYGSVLAALSPPGNPSLNRCPEALNVLDQVLEAYPDDPIFSGIANENSAICRIVEGAVEP